MLLNTSKKLTSQIVINADVDINNDIVSKDSECIRHDKYELNGGKPAKKRWQLCNTLGRIIMYECKAFI